MSLSRSPTPKDRPVDNDGRAFDWRHVPDIESEEEE
jgi:hypothetical protein